MPQVHTNLSINNKNTNSHSVVGVHKQDSDAKKYLLPSGSSGTLMRKESNNLR